MITEAEALGRLRAMTAADTDPGLNVDELGLLLDGAKRADRFGVWPTVDGWEPTFDLDHAAAEGWRWKAGKTTSDYSANLDGAQLARNQRHDHCVKMAEEYENRVSATFSVPRDRARSFGLSGDVIANG